MIDDGVATVKPVLIIGGAYERDVSFAGQGRLSTADLLVWLKA